MTRHAALRLGLLLALLAACAGLWIAVQRAADERGPDRAAIMRKAAAMTEQVMSYRAASAEDDITAAERLMTQRMREDYVKSLPTATERASQAKTSIQVKAEIAPLDDTGDATAVSVVSATDDEAKVLLFVDQSATASNVKKTVLSPTWELVTLVRRDGTWLIDDMEAPGATVPLG